MHYDQEHRLVQIGRKLRPAPGPSTTPDWRQADPRWLDQAYRAAAARPSGGWYVVDASSRIGNEPRCVTIAGQHLVAWRAHGRVQLAPNRCPHMGATLHDGRVRDGKLVCKWHGLALGAEGHGRWRPLPAHDDGVLTWVRLDEAGQEWTEAPVLAERPRLDKAVSAVVRMEASCEPEHVIRNRLDPWHGVHFHPHSFGTLHVIDQQADEVTVRVTYRIAGPLGVQVDARFHCPEPRTIVMTIVAGDGAGSVVETHATPIAPGRTAVIEATIATSDRPGFRFARRARRLLRPLMESMAARLWVEDTEYAERLYELEQQDAATTSGDLESALRGLASSSDRPSRTASGKA
jgi:isorenieratene synthase